MFIYPKQLNRYRTKVNEESLARFLLFIERLNNEVEAILFLVEELDEITTLFHFTHKEGENGNKLPLMTIDKTGEVKLINRGLELELHQDVSFISTDSLLDLAKNGSFLLSNKEAFERLEKPYKSFIKYGYEIEFKRLFDDVTSRLVGKDSKRKVMEYITQSIAEKPTIKDMLPFRKKIKIDNYLTINLNKNLISRGEYEDYLTLQKLLTNK